MDKEPMTDVLFLGLCKREVAEWFNAHRAEAAITDDDVFASWYCKTLQNWKGLFATKLPDGMYYELTLNGDKGELYLDAYKKAENVRIEL